MAVKQQAEKVYHPSHLQEPKSGTQQAIPDLSDPAVFPDGGLQAWLVVAGGFFALFASFGWVNCIGVFQDYYSRNQLKDYSASAIAWIPSTESFMLFFLGPVSGKLCDDYGPRVPILIGSLLHVLGIMMVSISTKYYQIFLAQSICSAIGCCFLFNASVTATGSWFKKRRALAFGIMISGSSLGGIVLPIMVDYLVPKIGFGWTIRTLAFMFLAFLTFGNLTIRSRLNPIRRPLILMDFVTPFTERPFLLLTISAFFIYLGGFLPFVFIIVQAKSAGMSTRLAGYLVPIINAASTFGRIIPGHLADLYGVYNVMIALVGFGALICLALWVLAQSNATIIVFAALYGFTSGCFFSMLPAMVARLSDVQKLGVRNGAMYAMACTGVLIGSPIAGAIVTSQNGEYTGLKIFCGVSLLAATVFAAASRTALVGTKLIIKV